MAQQTDRTHAMTIRIEPDVLETARIEALKRRTTFSALVSEALKKLLKLKAA